ncbi:hypothetical protein MYX06_01050 [Patescibacteria group bacterium AH-259-L05]|nr:hypothetical protein [Patescibacteria group bacterium AH-259-L05]
MNVEIVSSSPILLIILGVVAAAIIIVILALAIIHLRPKETKKEDDSQSLEKGTTPSSTSTKTGKKNMFQYVPTKGEKVEIFHKGRWGSFGEVRDIVGSKAVVHINGQPDDDNSRIVHRRTFDKIRPV